MQWNAGWNFPARKGSALERAVLPQMTVLWQNSFLWETLRVPEGGDFDSGYDLAAFFRLGGQIQVATIDFWQWDRLPNLTYDAPSNLTSLCLTSAVFNQ